ncbi:MAG: YchF family ATPase [Patescibacteria group bacterium]|nr:YchF family ATPase [Patescibacteria group bacterium]MDE2015622.1 YchF family ATPase [Patescibacteria group bacterium]MDE2226679.1 YchF family ATPase [Patescibacteria group bacterium]
MKLSIGIVGLPNVGKSTLFKILTKQDINIANYPFATIDPNVGVVPVPDERLAKLAEMSHSKKILPAVVEFYDIAGLVKGANKGEGLGNQFLANIRETQAIVVVLRTFENSEIIHVENSVDPMRDLEIINSELALKDLETVDKRLQKLEGEARTGDKKAVRNLEILKAVKEELNKGNLTIKFADEEIMKELQLLTGKKQLYLLNGPAEGATKQLLDKIKSLGGDYLASDLGNTNVIPELIKEAYKVLGLISFLTTGEDETRAWTIQDGAKAPQAAGVIHTDFEKNFIRAEVVNWQKLLEAGSWVNAKQKGLIKLEGKDYVIQDGDVVVVRHG